MISNLDKTLSGLRIDQASAELAAKSARAARVMANPFNPNLEIVAYQRQGGRDIPVFEHINQVSKPEAVAAVLPVGGVLGQQTTAVVAVPSRPPPGFPPHPTFPPPSQIQYLDGSSAGQHSTALRPPLIPGRVAPVHTPVTPSVTAVSPPAGGGEGTGLGQQAEKPARPTADKSAVKAAAAATDSKRAAAPLAVNCRTRGKYPGGGARSLDRRAGPDRWDHSWGPQFPHHHRPRFPPSWDPRWSRPPVPPPWWGWPDQHCPPYWPRWPGGGPVKPKKRKKRSQKTGLASLTGANKTPVNPEHKIMVGVGAGAALPDEGGSGAVAALPDISTVATDKATVSQPVSAYLMKAADKNPLPPIMEEEEMSPAPAPALDFTEEEEMTIASDSGDGGDEFTREEQDRLLV